MRLISDKLMGSSKGAGQKNLYNQERKNTFHGKGNTVSKTNFSVKEAVSINRTRTDNLFKIFSENIILLSHEIFDCSLIMSFIRYTLSPV